MKFGYGDEAIIRVPDNRRRPLLPYIVVTAYRDRDSAGFKKTISGLAWNSFAWFVSEPENILILRNGGESPALLTSLLGGR